VGLAVVSLQTDCYSGWVIEVTRTVDDVSIIETIMDKYLRVKRG
jgi:uncharacterized protein (DUF39 family)